MAEMMLYDGSTAPPTHFWPTRSVVANRMAAYLRLQSGMFTPQSRRLLQPQVTSALVGSHTALVS